MNIIFLGPPGAGKGTQAQIVCRELGIPQISTGDMLRSAISAGTETGLKAKGFMDAGELVPDEIVIAIVKERLAMDDCKNGYILDGFPRTVAQAQELGKFVKIDAVINLEVENEVIIKRLSGRRVCPKCGAPYHVDRLGGKTTCTVCDTALIHRDDDQPEAISNRLNVYQAKTAPLIDYYRSEGVLKNINGGLSLEEISGSIMNALEAAK